MNALREEVIKALRALDAQAITSSRFVEWVREAAYSFTFSKGENSGQKI